MTSGTDQLPVVVIGAGPVGLATAAHLRERGLAPLVLEAGDDIAPSVGQWAQVRMFSPWRYNVDAAAQRMLEAHGWDAPDPDGFPTGGDLVQRYLRPLATALGDVVQLGHRVVGVARSGLDKARTADRLERPFAVVVRSPRGTTRILARAVVDASGTWTSPAPLGADGLPALGEHEAAERISYGIPDVMGAQRARFAGRHVAVVGSGHSAQHLVRDLVELRRSAPGTEVTWLVRRPEAGQMFGGGATDGLPARGALGADARRLVADGAVAFVTGFRTAQVARAGEGLVLGGDDGRKAGPFDEVIGVTGFRPDLSFLRELHLELDPVVETTPALAPLIDPNLHSCGTVRPHGAAELAHPEPDVYLVGMKSYGRAPTFLLATGYEQVRSVAAQLAGDHEAATRVQLALPETGVCCGDSPIADTPGATLPLVELPR